ncbi:hypothetical protein NDU88_003200 [Pleurodeles waltl]|uniref:Uncharacterized protein n=1 Tax=Pleurodeles waltl TaxID=8319 RepID=A0AAV7MPW4_PLEWA|nr:hypothetical protein NDU88_003200 [Pleurodeles waltl]
MEHRNECFYLLRKNHVCLTLTTDQTLVLFSQFPRHSFASEYWYNDPLCRKHKRLLESGLEFAHLVTSVRRILMTASPGGTM